MKKRNFPADENEDIRRPKRWIGCPIEAEYLGEERKLGKVQRKLASKKDRSQFKKSDLAKKQKQASQEPILDKNLLRGRVLSISSQGIVVEEDGKQIICSLRGTLKQDKGQIKNLVTVGDYVRYALIGSDEGVISYVEPRRSVLSRADNLSRRKEQLIAANVDQVLITVSVVSPQLKPPLIDRYIIAASKGGMAPILVINKIDLLEAPAQDPILQGNERALYQELLQAYKIAGIQVISVSTVTGEGMEALREAMQGKTSVFSGQSGVGKSSLINALTGLALRTGHIVEKTGKGIHSTSTATLLSLSFGGWCIDTPGIKSFGVWDLKKEEIEEYYAEIYAIGRDCKYPDCTHSGEAGCAVVAAVEEGKISPLRLLSYLYLLDSVSQKHMRR